MRITIHDDFRSKREHYEDIIRDCEYTIRQATLRKALMEQNLKELDEEEQNQE